MWIGSVVLLWLSCTTVSEDKKNSSVLPVDTQKRTVRTSDDWVFPKTTLIPEVSDDNPLVSQAEEFFLQDKNLEAAQILLEVLEKDPDNVTAHSLLSAVLIQLGDLAQATAAAKKVVELSPSAWSYCNLGTVYVLAKSFKEAKQAFETAMELNPKYFLALRNLGSIAYQEQRYEAAELYFQYFIRIDPEDTYAYVGYGEVLAEQGKLEAAKNVYMYRLQELEWDSDARRRTPSGLTLDLPLGLAEIYSRQGNVDEAVRWFLQTIQWSWAYKGYWTSESSYADTAYQRLVLLIQSLSIPVQKKYYLQLMTWFQEHKQSIPSENATFEEGRFTQWIQTLEVGP